MGYSTPKKPLDLKELLSQPGKKPSRKRFTYVSPRRSVPVETQEEDIPSEVAESSDKDR